MTQGPNAFHLVASASLTITESFLFVGQTVRSRELPIECSRLLPLIFHSVESTYCSHPVAKQTGKCLVLFTQGVESAEYSSPCYGLFLWDQQQHGTSHCQAPILTNETSIPGYSAYIIVSIQDIPACSSLRLGTTHVQREASWTVVPARPLFRELTVITTGGRRLRNKMFGSAVSVQRKCSWLLGCREELNGSS